MDWQPLFLSLRLAVVSTVLLLVLGIPLARWIGLSVAWPSRVVRALVQIPMVLPPTVVGFYLLVVLSPGSPFGQFLDRVVGVRLLFTFPGLVVASVLTGLPFLVSNAVAGFQSLPPNVREASLCLGRGPWITFWRVEAPLAFPSILAGTILAFLHTLGEFGVVLMI
ncbi:MAG TPA: ABC transporter permease subunit, partial [Fibrobacteria bacterium]|nr:ABC transporter permease subunit [Fibrobacteria bacterium]